MGWINHWGLNRDPFVDRGANYVPVPGHEEAVARLVHAIEAGHRLAVLTAPAGMGKTVVLGRALAEARDPCRRFALAISPSEAGHLYFRLAEKLGTRGSAEVGPWRRLAGTGACGSWLRSPWIPGRAGCG